MGFQWIYFVCMCILIFVVNTNSGGKVHSAGTTKRVSHRTNYTRAVAAPKSEPPSFNKSINNVTSDQKLFDTSSFENMTHLLAQLGSVAVLTCRVPNEENMTVTWRKVNSSEVLTVNLETVNDDKRYLAVRSKDATDTVEWKLRIRYTQESDNALFECDVSGKDNKKMKDLSYSIYSSLRLKKAYAKIIGGKSKIVKANSPLRISCVLKNSIEPPKYIFWYKGDSVINYDLTDGATVREGRQGTELIVPRANSEIHSGNYSCVPSNAIQASVLVSVE